MNREEEIANRIYAAIARILAEREECDITVKVTQKPQKKEDGR